MHCESALTKRIRRQIRGRVLDFFAATAPGLEEICLGELRLLPLSAKEMRIVKGGVEFRGRLHDCYLASLHLRTANRILMRLGECRTEGFAHLEKKVKALPWELWLHPGCIPDFSIRTSRCRLYHTEAIRERVEKSIRERMSAMEKDAETPYVPADGIHGDKGISQRIFIRGIRDVFHFSIDSSGEHLHKRGIKAFRADAPLRETNAAAVLQIAGYDSREPLLDPMCGSGTFAIEAAMMAHRIAPGLFRDFAFRDWPSFQPGRWRHLRREAREQIIAPGAIPNIFASDADEKACRAAEQNTVRSPVAGMTDISHADFFSFSPAQRTAQTGLAVLNPPYGLRMGTDAQSAQLYPAICHHLAKVYKGWKIALICPNKKEVEKFPFDWNNRPFFHGGLKLTLMCGKVPRSL